MLSAIISYVISEELLLIQLEQLNEAGKPFFASSAIEAGNPITLFPQLELVFESPPVSFAAT